MGTQGKWSNGTTKANKKIDGATKANKKTDGAGVGTGR